MKKPFLTLVAALLAVSASVGSAQQKVGLEPPKEGDLVKELSNSPDGVLRVRTNEDGTFRSLVVRSTVEIEDVLGAAKGKMIAHKEAEAKCKATLAKWLEENCLAAESTAKGMMIVTKGESTTDAAGNKVVIKSQKATETKLLGEMTASKAQAVLRGLIVLQSEVTADKEPMYVLILGLSQENMTQAAAVAGALADPNGGERSGGGAVKKPALAEAPAPEVKTNPEAKGF